MFLEMICLDCLANAALCYGLWMVVPQSASSLEVQALSVFGVGIASKSIMNAFAIL